MSAYDKIKYQIEKNNIQTITIDIFDTILMRKIWPEENQFLYVAKKWLPHFQRVISSDITEYKIYSWRLYARNELFQAYYELPNDQTETQAGNQADYDINLEIWFSHLVDILADTYHTSLSIKARRQLIEQMIAIEMETEKEMLYANDKLVGDIQRVKNEFPHLKVYFLSDMYLSGDKIKEILGYFEIDIFDDGCSSTDEQYTKHSGKLYHHINNNPIFDEVFDLFYNLHIGDSEWSDYKMASLAGSYAIHYHPYRLRGFRTGIGGLRCKIINYLASKRDNQKLKLAFDKGSRSSWETWRQFGKLFSQPLYSFLLHVGISAKQSPDATYLMVSSEATMFQKLGKSAFPNTFSAKNIKVAPKLNRKMMLRALLWFLANNYDKDFNMKVIANTIFLGEVSGERREIYEFFFGKGFPYGELILNRRSEDEFYEALLNDIKIADEKYTVELRKAYNYAYRFLPNNKEQLIIVDVGWGGTVQVLLSQFVKLHGINSKVEGLYLGKHTFDRFGIHAPSAVGYLLPDVLSANNRELWNAIIWEYAYTNKVQYPEDEARLAQIQAGFSDGLELFRNIEYSPKSYFDKFISPRIRRLISRPTREEVEAIGSIRFDQGFVDKQIFSIVDMHLSRRKLWLGLIRHPRSTLRGTVFIPNAWSYGYLKYYRMYGVRFILKVVRKFRRKRYV